MWCWRPPQIGHHQGKESMRRACSTAPHRQREHGFDAVSFRTIRTDINGPFLLSKSYIAAATHD